MRILTTGAYGQLGRELNLQSASFPKWKFRFTDVDSLDISNESAVENYFQQYHPDFVINCAAYTAVDHAETDAETAEKVNALAPKLLARSAQQTGAKIIHVSTDYVFDGNVNSPYLETDTVNPQSVYGATKLRGEQNCLAENPESVVIRTSWLYSAFGNNFVKTMIRLGSEREKLNVVFDQIGTPTYAADLASTILFIIQASENKAENFIPGIYHYSNQGVASWYDFAKAVFEMADINCEVSPVLSDRFPTAAKRPAYSVLNKAKIRTNFGIEIPYWRDSLRVCLRGL